ncbi:MAG: glucokinase [Thioalkalivibrionaceae bacterium]
MSHTNRQRCDLVIDIGGTHIRWTRYAVPRLSARASIEASDRLDRHESNACDGLVSSLRSSIFPSLESFLMELLGQLEGRDVLLRGPTPLADHCCEEPVSVRSVIIAVPGPVKRVVTPTSRPREVEHANGNDTRPGRQCPDIKPLLSVNHFARFTNLPWPDVDELSLSQRFSRPVRLINDLAAMALSVGVATIATAVSSPQPSIRATSPSIIGDSRSDEASSLTGPAPTTRISARNTLDEQSMLGLTRHAQAAVWPLAGSPPIDTSAPILVVGIGTGFGSALRVPIPSTHDVADSPPGGAPFSLQDARRENESTQTAAIVIAGEGGHARLDLSGLKSPPPAAAVSREHWLSGGGLVRFAVARLDRAESERLFGSGSPDLEPAAPVALLEAARDGDKTACRVMDEWVDLLAGALADLALGAVPTGGIVLGGGVTEHVSAWLDRPRLRDAFCQRSPMESLLETIPLGRLGGHEPSLLGLRTLCERL